MPASRPSEFSTQPQSKMIRLRDIANALGVSIGTVDRALHGKPGVSPMTRQRVLSMAQNLHYRPNLAARALSSRKETRIAVTLPKTNCSFFDDVCRGVEEAASASQDTRLKLSIQRYPWTREAEVEAFAAALEDNTKALIISPGNPSEIKPLIRQAAKRRVPVLCVTTDAPGTDRLTCISIDHVVAGSIAAELMGQMLSGEGTVLLATGNQITIDHADKVKGFRDCAKSMFPAMRVAGVVEDHESEEESYKKCKEALVSDTTIKGIYATTANSVPILRVLEELRLAGKVKLVATDLFPEIVSAMRSGTVAAIVYQKPFDQGRMAFQTIYRFLVENVCPRARIRLLPDIVLRSSLELFLARDRRHSLPAQ
jgi:LacI family transcriptional regulator